MDKVIKGTKDLKNYQIIKGTPDQREIRCTNCKNVATQVPDGKGGFVCTCPNCGAKFTFKRI
jgi:DNA-directed RNA polymerase subunit RPC12/RpoP